MELNLILLAALAVVLLLLINRISKLRTSQVLDRPYVAKTWAEIVDMAKISERSAHHAVIEADKLVDYVLKAHGFNGDTMGERLKSAKPSLKNNDAIWQAHRLRNKLVHEQNLRIKEVEVKQALSGFFKALKDLGAL